MAALGGQERRDLGAGLRLTLGVAHRSDVARKGLPLCADHHLAFDAGIWSIDPAGTVRGAKAEGHSLPALRITRSNLTHLPAQPHPDACA